MAAQAYPPPPPSDEVELLEAIHTLFRGEDPDRKAAANRWLERWQQEPVAWSLSDRVLHNQANDLECHHFCAQTLKTKVYRDFEELPAEAIPSLRDSIFTLLLQFAKGAPPVRTQLCLALAGMAAHMPAQQWGEGGAVRWLAARFSTVSADVALPCMLEMLTVLPQEADSHKIALRPERRRRFEEELKAAVSDALDVLASCLSQPGDRVREQVLEAFAAWLRLTGGRGLPANLMASQLVIAAVQGLDSDSIFHASVDAVTELIWITVDPNDSTPKPEMQSLMLAIVPKVMALQPRFKVAMRRWEVHLGAEWDDDKDGVEDEWDDDFDTAKGIARLFCEVGEACIQVVLAATPDVNPPVEALLQVANFDDEEIRSMSYNFWHKLCRQLTTSFSSRGNSSSTASTSAPARPGADEGPGAEAAAAAAAAERARRAEFFRPALETLMAQTQRHMRLPPSHETWSNSDWSAFNRNRREMGGILLDAAAALGAQRSMELLLAPLEKLGQEEGRFDWETAEAALYAIRCVRKAVTSGGADDKLHSVVSALPSLPQEHKQMQYTAALVAAAYADWLAEQAKAGRGVELLPRLLQSFLELLDDPIAAPACASAVRHLCDACGPFMRGCVDLLMQYHVRVLASGAAAAGGAGAANGGSVHLSRLKEEDVQLVLEGVCLCVGRCIPDEQLVQGIGALATPVLEPFAAAMQALPLSNASISTATLALIDRLATLLSTIGRPAVAADLLLRAWPGLDAGFSRAGSDSRGVERLCRTLRHGIKAAGKACGQLLPTLLEALPIRFAQTRQPAFMYVVSELVKVFGDEPAADGSMGPILVQLLGASCAGLTSVEAMENAPELVDDSFLLAGRTLHYCPRMLVVPALLPALLDTAMLGVLVQHREACCSVLTFLCRILDPKTMRALNPEPQALLQTQLARVAPTLTRLLLAGALGALPDARVPDVADVLSQLLQSGGAAALSWVGGATALLPDVAATSADKELFLGAAAALASGSEMTREEADFLDALEGLADLCRRNKRARIGAQQALLPPELAQSVH